MDSERPLDANHGLSRKKSGGESDRLSESTARDGAPSQELACIEELLRADCSCRRGKPLTVDELLTICGKAFEPLFHEPPIGPIPEYLAPHLTVHGCVAEYEEKLEELDRWKALQLHRWLEDRIGKRWCVAGKVYELLARTGKATASEVFWLKLTDDQPEVVS